MGEILLELEDLRVVVTLEVVVLEVVVLVVLVVLDMVVRVVRVVLTELVTWRVARATVRRESTNRRVVKDFMMELVIYRDLEDPVMQKTEDGVMNGDGMGRNSTVFIYGLGHVRSNRI